MGAISCGLSIFFITYWMSFSWNFLNWYLSLFLPLLFLITVLASSKYPLKSNRVDDFFPCLTILFLLLFIPPPECDPLLFLVDFSRFPWFEIISSTFRGVVVGGSDADIIFVLGVQTLSSSLEVLLPDVNFTLTGLTSLNIILLFPSWVHYIWVWCYVFNYFFKLMLK